MRIDYYTVNAFAKTKTGGNPAGVVLEADELSETEMKSIAAHIGFSETAFVMRSGQADFKLRFFTPNEEVDLCGHATVGAFYAMFSLGIIKPGAYSQQTQAGLLHVNISEEGIVMMQQALPVLSDMPDREEIADSLHIPLSLLSEDLPVQVVSTGLRDIIVPVRDLRALFGLSPNPKKVEEISRRYQTVGYHAFTFETLHGADIHCRNFAPLYGIPEEAATGTSNGALACYLSRYGRLPVGIKQLRIEQGYCMDRPSEIIAVVESNLDIITDIQVGGKATTPQKYSM